MSKNITDYVQHLLYQASSKNNQEAFKSLKKLYRTPSIDKQIDSKTLTALKDFIHKQHDRSIASSNLSKRNLIEEGKYQQKMPHLDNALNMPQSDLDSSDRTVSKRIDSRLIHKASDSFDRMVKANKTDYSIADIIGTSVKSANGKKHSPIHLSSKVTPISTAPSLSWTQEKNTSISKQSNNISFDKIPRHLYKNGFMHPVPSDTTKISYDLHHKLSSFNSTIVNNDLNIKHLNRTNIVKENSHSSLLPNEDSQINGFLDINDISDSSRKETFNKHHSRSNRNNLDESSHSSSKRNSHGTEGHSKLTFHQKVPSPAIDSSIKSNQTSNKGEVRSPGKFPVSYTSSPVKKSLNSSQKLDNRSSRPDCFSSSNEFSNEDRPDDCKNLTIDTSDNACNGNLEQNPKPPSPYSVQLKQGMFKAVKCGSEKDTLKVQELKHIGSGMLEDGGFSWGWCIEKRCSFSMSSSKERTSSATPRDVNKCKRKIEYEKVDPGTSPPNKRHHYLKDSSTGKDKHKETLLNGVAEMKEKRSVDMKREYYKSSNSGDDKYSKKPSSTEKPKPSGSSFLKKGSPNVVPSSDGNVPIPKPNCDDKSSKVIDNSNMDFITSKKERRTIYSGRKNLHEIPTLKNFCLEYLKKNILNVKIGENTPYDVVQPILESCSSSKLYKVEEQNKHLSKNTNDLWEKMCRKEFRDQVPTGEETWKEVYLRARSKQEKKLKSIAASISNGIAKAPPERQAKYLGVDSYDPEKRRKAKVESEPPPKLEQNGRSGSSSKSSESESSCSPQFNSKPVKVSKSTKKIAPLMSKTKKMLNLVNRRR